MRALARPPLALYVFAAAFLAQLAISGSGTWSLIRIGLVVALLWGAYRWAWGILMALQAMSLAFWAVGFALHPTVTNLFAVACGGVAIAALVRPSVDRHLARPVRRAARAA
jgi:hypothetical protein